MHDRLAIVSAERIRDELGKLLVVPKPSPGLWFVVETGLAAEFMPELPGLASSRTPSTAQGRPGPHPGRGGQDTARTSHPPGGAAPRHRQAPDPGLRACRRHLPSPRGGRGPHGCDRMTALRFSKEDIDTRHPPGRAPSALPYLPARLDRPGRPALCARRRALARPAERAHPLRLHHPQTLPGPAPSGCAWTSSRSGSRSYGPRRRSTPSVPNSTAVRSWTTSAWRPGPTGPGPRVPSRAAPGGGPPRRGRSHPPSRRLVGDRQAGPT